MEAGVGGGGFLGRDTWGRRRAGARLAGMPGAAEMRRLPGTLQDANRPRHSQSPGEGTVGVRLPKRPQPDSKKSRVRTQLQAGASDRLGVCRVTKEGQAAGLIKALQ